MCVCGRGGGGGSAHAASRLASGAPFRPCQVNHYAPSWSAFFLALCGATRPAAALSERWRRLVGTPSCRQRAALARRGWKAIKSTGDSAPDSRPRRARRENPPHETPAGPGATAPIVSPWCTRTLTWPWTGHARCESELRTGAPDKASRRLRAIRKDRRSFKEAQGMGGGETWGQGAAWPPRPIFPCLHPHPQQGG